MLLLTACSHRNEADPVISSLFESPPVASTESTDATPGVSAPITPAALTPSPLPQLPLNVTFTGYEFNDDAKKIYIKTIYIDSFEFEKNSIGYNLALLVEKDTNTLDEWLRKSAADYPATEDNYVTYGLTSIPEITENTFEYFSMYMDFYTYSGGAHGNLERYAYTYSSDGTYISDFTKLLTANVTVKDVETEINRQIKARIAGGDPVFYKDSVSLTDFDEYPPFFIRNGILVIFYQTYDIAPYVIGIPEFEMPSSIF